MRRVLLDSELGNLQAFGVSQKDLNTIERSLNGHKKVEIEETKQPGMSRPHTVIYVDGVLLVKIEGY